MITNKLYHRLRKFARGNIDFIEDFSLGHAENLPPKWQSRDARYRGVCRPSAGGLARYFLETPSALVAEPLPLYLNPAVRD